MKTPVLFAGSTSGPTASATRYAPIFMGNNAGGIWSSTSVYRCPVPIACSVSNLEVNLPVAQGAGHTSTLTIMKAAPGDANAADTALAATVDDVDTRGSNTADSVSLSAGDELTYKFASSAELQGVMQAGFLLTASVFGESAIFGARGGAVDGYAGFGRYEGSATEADEEVVFAAAGVLDNIYFRESVAPGVGNTWTYTFYLNGVAQSLSTTMTGTALTANTSGNPVTIAQGDRGSIRRNPTGGTPAGSACKFGARWVPTVPGESLLFSTWLTVVAAADRFGNANGVNNSSATEANFYNIVNYPCVIRKQTVQLATAPGATAKTRSVWLRKALVGGSPADTALTTVVTDPATSNQNNSDQVTISQSDVTTGVLIDIRTNSDTGAAAPVHERVGHVIYIAPPSSGPKGLLGDGLRGLLA